MFLVISAINQNVIDVNNHTDVEERFQDILNQGLECGRGIGESKGHDLILIVAISGTECCFLDVIFVDPNLVVSPSKINFGKHGSTLESVD